jgi:hypothetical protein
MGKLSFSPIEGTQNVPLERRSGTDINNRNNYGTAGYIPPGIYFLHYHRFDATFGGRHRLGLSDERCTDVIGRRAGGAPVDRSNVQFHIAFNDLNEFQPSISEGCITLRRDGFDRLFPGGFFGNSSPLPNCGGHALPPELSFNGGGNILVFVTDVSDANLQTRQYNLMRRIVFGDIDFGITSQIFDDNNPALDQLRARWYIGGP